MIEDIKFYGNALPNVTFSKKLSTLKKLLRWDIFMLSTNKFWLGVKKLYNPYWEIFYSKAEMSRISNLSCYPVRMTVSCSRKKWLPKRLVVVVYFPLYYRTVQIYCLIYCRVSSIYNIMLVSEICLFTRRTKTSQFNLLSLRCRTIVLSCSTTMDGIIEKVLCKTGSMSLPAGGYGRV